MAEKDFETMKKAAEDAAENLKVFSESFGTLLISFASIMEQFSELTEQMSAGTPVADNTAKSKKKTTKKVAAVEDDEADTDVDVTVPDPKSKGNDKTKMSGKKYDSIEEGDMGKVDAPKVGDDDFREADIHVLDREYLDSLAYEDLMYYGSEFKLSNAKYKNLTDRREHLVDIIMDYIEKELEKEAESKNAKKTTSKSKKAVKVIKEPEPEDEGDYGDGSEVMDDDELLYNKILDATKDMTTEEIADQLADAGLSPRGKRQALIDKLFNAVKDGKIEWDDEDDDSEDYDDEDEEDTADLVEDDIDDEDGEDEGYAVNDYDNPEMPKARKKALMAFEKEVRKMLKDKTLTTAKMKKALTDFYPKEKDAIKSMSAEEVFNAYVDMKQYFIDDEGESYGDSDAYYVNGIPYCCGEPLRETEDGTLECAICGEAYEL